MDPVPPRAFPSLRPRLVAAVVGFWALVGLFAGLQGAVTTRLGGARLFQFWDPLKAALVWTLLTLGAIRLASRFPLRGRRWPLRLVLHLVASGMATFILNGGIRLMDQLLGTGEGFTGLAAYLTSSVRWLHINALVYWVVVGLAHGAALLREREARAVRQAELEARLTRAELRALRAQLHPHFLFNALHTVGLLWRTGRGEEAQETMERLASLLRRVTDPERGQEAPLGRELELTREYLAIEEVRFGDRLHLEERVEPEALDAWVPTLLLQPLVENAVRHGIEGRADAGLVAVEAERTRDGFLEIRVVDDGPGPPRSWSEGTGLANTRERLQRLYGDRHELELERRGPRGARIRVRIPFRAEPVVEDRIPQADPSVEEAR